MSLTAENIYGLTKGLLMKRYDMPVPIPNFHIDLWHLVTDPAPYVAIAAPRGHAKSTAITHAYTLAAILFREARYVLIVSDTQDQSIQFLSDLKTELLENEDLRELFGVKGLTKDAATDIICEMEDGWKFRVSALGSEQKVRGRKWGGTRPDLVVGDDLENDEMVESQDRREKFRNWFFKALVPVLSRRGKIRIVGTILHLDSLLFRLMSNRSWKSALYSAHKGFDDFSMLLWPEQWPKERLEAVRQGYIDEGFPEGYSQEYLNNPIDIQDAFFRGPDFLEMEEEHHGTPKTYYAGIDFAISDSERADYTVIVVGGMDAEGILHIVQVVRFRGTDIVDNMLAIQQRWDIALWKAEEGAIKKSIGPEIERRMIETGIFMNISPGVPTKDKRSRARTIQARLRAGGVRFNKEADWYATFEEELLHFPKGQKKDQVDAFAWLGLGLSELVEGPTTQDIEDEEWENEFNQSVILTGRNKVTGY